MGDQAALIALMDRRHSATPGDVARPGVFGACAHRIILTTVTPLVPVMYVGSLFAVIE